MSFFGSRGAIDAVAELLKVLEDPSRFKAALEEIRQEQNALKLSQDMHANVKEQAAASLNDADTVKRDLEARAAELLSKENALKAWEADNAQRQTDIEARVRKLADDQKAFDEAKNKRLADIEAYNVEQNGLWEGRISEFKAEMQRQRNELAIAQGELNTREAAISKREAELQSRIDALKAL
jgi:chromosome segregation ATPase